MVGPAGIEPATLGLEIRCSIRLSYGPSVTQVYSLLTVDSGAVSVPVSAKPSGSFSIAQPLHGYESKRQMSIFRYRTCQPARSMGHIGGKGTR